MRQQPADFKIRTREHVIADLSVNSVERLILLEGHIAYVPSKDYGYDFVMHTFENGSLEPGNVLFQLKATHAPNYLGDGLHLSFRVTRADLNLWSVEPMPVCLVVWDASSKTGYWLHMQRHLRQLGILPLRNNQASTMLRIPLTNIFDRSAVEILRQRKNAVTRQFETR